MLEDNNLDENMAEFNEIMIDLENISEKIDAEDQAIILLSSLLFTYNQLKDTIKYHY